MSWAGTRGGGNGGTHREVRVVREGNRIEVAREVGQSDGAAASNQAIAAKQKIEVYPHEFACHPLVRRMLPD